MLINLFNFTLLIIIFSSIGSLLLREVIYIYLYVPVEEVKKAVEEHYYYQHHWATTLAAIVLILYIVHLHPSHNAVGKKNLINIYFFMIFTLNLFFNVHF